MRGGIEATIGRAAAMLRPRRARGPTRTGVDAVLLILAAARISHAADVLERVTPVPATHAQPEPSAAAISLEQAYAAAERLVASRRHMESLPYFRRMIGLMPEDEWLHHDYANALQGASLQGRTILGLPVPATRASDERVDLMRRAFEVLDRARQLARSPRAAASVHEARSRQLEAWGFPRDALAEARKAAAADPSWDVATRRIRRLSNLDTSAGASASVRALGPVGRRTKGGDR